MHWECPNPNRSVWPETKLPATSAIKHQVRKLMLEEAVKKAETGAGAEAILGQLREEIRPLVHSV
jgi:hypothetical protein